ncbi:hypothetical protein PR048_030497 [Dryococelus australis]|uniref:FAD/NAD(P)-binding domain-containing protein n=1 Tax=Dryococelus australis TaxID=614101 RepID=A0ABQ9G975_9NEOP|nr:hypothetical protein PR048_030497 [Dryococelus australis]
MRNQNTGTTALDDAVYKDVVVVGNGPSGMMLSYLLAGNVPYYTGQPHPADEMLTARLRSSATGGSLLDQDLQFLSQGLEGRSRSPVSLLADMLLHPCADMGLDYPSLLEWRHEPFLQVDHVVLGKGPPGGVWQMMDGNVLTISLGSWMELPDFPFRQWEAIHTAGGPQHFRNSRVPARSVARYYSDYVQAKKLGRFFRNSAVVTAITPLEPQSPSSACKNQSEVSGPEVRARWRIDGYDATSSVTFSYVCRDVVLATGGHDVPNMLHVPGELENPSWVMHNLSQLEKVLDTIAANQGMCRCRNGTARGAQCDPVVIVGAGLSAADAVIAARFRGLPVVHVFRSRTPQFSGRQLPEDMYPEYHKVHQMMNDRGRSYRLYTALAEHKVLEITSDRKVRLQSPDGKVVVCTASVVAVLIGSRPNLSILPPELNLAGDSSRPVDCHANPVQVELFSYAAVRAPEGMYAMGPLVGDNFVRFIQGGTLAVATDIHKNSSRKEEMIL